MLIRRATPEDYPHFVRLVPELAVDDPVPTAARWAEELAPQTWIAEDGAVLGYCYVQRLDQEGYVRHLVTSPEARRRGVGRALLDHVRADLRAHGARGWRLNVKPENTAARALYAAVGMVPRHESTALRMAWAGFAAFPDEGLTAHPIDDFAAVEQAWHLPKGQLAHAVSVGRRVYGVDSAGVSVGLAVYDPKFPGAFPFRARSLGAARALAEAIAADVTTPDLQFVVEDNAAITDAALAAGAVLRLRALHYVGAF